MTIPRSWQAKVLVFLCIVATIAALFLWLTPSGRQFVAHVLPDVQRGVIHDADTGSGLTGAEVLIRSTGFDYTRGIMNATEMGFATSNRTGQFAVKYRRLGKTLLYVRRQGYATAVAIPVFGPFVNVRLASVGADASQVIHTAIPLRFDSLADVQYVQMGTGRAVGDSTHADLAISLAEDIERRMILRAVNGAGLQRDTTTVLPHDDIYAVECTAPSDGYVVQEQIATWDQPVMCFIRSRSGDRYGRILIPRQPRVQNLFYIIGMTYNPTGGRCVCRVPRREERFWSHK